MPKCLHHQTKFKAALFNQKFCLSDDECKAAATEYILVKIRKADARKKAKAAKDEKKEWNNWKREHRKTAKRTNYKNYLQDEINALSKMIDLKFEHNTCIDCGGPFGVQTDACHYHGRGSNHSLKYHLHNLHSGNSQHNQFSDKHKVGYAQGLIKRYGNDYLEMVEALPLKYPKIKLSAFEVAEKLALVRKLIRDFETFVFEDARQAREQLNKIIGIYN